MADTPDVKSAAPKRLRRRRRALIGIVIAAAATLAIFVAVADRSGTGTNPLPPAVPHQSPIGFVDDAGTLQISIQLSPDQPDTGGFTITVPHLGLLSASAELSPQPDGSIGITYRGPADLVTTVENVDGTNSPPSDNSQIQPKQQKELVLDGVVDVASRTAQLHLAISSVQDTHADILTLIETPADPLTAQKAISDLLDALRKHDTAALRAALAPGALTPNEQQGLTEQLQLIDATALQTPPASPSNLETLPDGHRVYTVTVTRPNTSLLITLILLDRRWYLLL
jgi:hypothetical protein